MLTVAAIIGGLAVQTAPASPPLAEVLPRAAALCAKAAETNSWSLEKGTDFYEPEESRIKLPAGEPSGSRAAKMIAQMNAGMKTLADTPPLIQRVIGHSQSRMMFKISMAARFPAASGEVWVIFYNGNACDLYVTGSSEPVAPLAASLANTLGAQGWQTAAAVDAGEKMPLSQRLLLRAAPKPDMPGYGVRAKMQWLSPAAADSEGVQLDISYLAGNVGAAQPDAAQKP
ncbi:hypothetical protein [Sphingomonas kyeonggiensis]|uniref:Uncharacterized protein n=1 Tax=Sphingomonas kyeonggiensis TaxID=1268553 RepID=A0A7W6NZM7_9SPHN|nr:hypothetical protein [Sphingomonas kyeonggiensis]MBB4100809.1 hypothetical protein [Sphingomonas kyeonggiensis]